MESTKKKIFTIEFDNVSQFPSAINDFFDIVSIIKCNLIKFRK